jgi:hypothetical protein
MSDTGELILALLCHTVLTYRESWTIGSQLAIDYTMHCQSIYFLEDPTHNPIVTNLEASVV